MWRASTVVFDDMARFARRKENLYDGYTYGTTGTPTSRELEARIAALEGGNHCVVVPSGQAALCLVLLALVRAGDHVLVPESAYGPLKTFVREWMQGYGVEFSFYPPSAGSEIASRITPTTRVVMMESPGSVTMEIQDVPAIAAAARAAGAISVVDNTWATPLGFQPLAHGVDVCVEAASKQFGGHSDVLLGAITTNDRGLYEKLRRAQSVIGLPVSPDDCFLVLRGLETLKVRVHAQGRAAEQIATWVARQPEVAEMFYPPLPQARGHALWKRDFSACGCVMSFAVAPGVDEQAMGAFFNALQIFSIGASWGSVHSLAGYYPAAEQAARANPVTRSAVVRLSIGLEDPEALIADLDSAFRVCRAALR
ncbi:PLP-dependent transferase [Ramlibacter tataouinensis]|uniref:trans-sulfuration enzyme family protein n=1 Tax=Ramlibacter tataouinensis TaxID=94132 RepID=UPI0022F3805A|nr:PLP-dependent transferase [Ramlibacter tataouinensis]WBY00541.1 PLP-dependent transferase [Ramlibacter tataouinensis]